MEAGVEVARCTGHCCRCFTVFMSPVQIGQALLATRRGERAVQDIETVAAMLVYLGHSDGNPEEMREPGLEAPGHFYTCKHFQGGNCAIYEQRPTMCRNYPSGSGGCEYAGCTRRVEDREAATSLAATG